MREGTEQTNIGAVVANSWRVEALLATGDGITTFLGKDLRDGRRFVIKEASSRTLADGARARLAFQQAALEEVDGGPVRLASDGDVLHWVRPFVEGETLGQRLLRGPLAPRQVIDLGAAVVAQLAHAHARGVLHGDLKPSNVVFDATTARPVLIDFGLHRHTGTVEGARTIPLADAAHLSPEQSGLLGAHVDARSDLFAVGVLLYQAASGHPPFPGATIGDVLRAQLTTRPLPLDRHHPGIPPLLDAIIEKLLRKDPRDRYQTAEGALADLRELGRALDAGRPPTVVVGAQDRRRVVTEPAFIGRTEERDRLETALTKARAGQGGLVIVEGSSGTGKTWLLQEIGNRALSAGTVVLRGRGLDQSAPQPFQALATVARELLASVHETPDWGEQIARQVGSAGNAIVASLPELAALFSATDEASPGPEAHGEERSLTALATLLDALGSAERPVLVLIDDVQWADEATLRLLDRWQTHRSGPRFVLVALAARTEDLPATHLVRQMGATERLQLGAFGPDEVQRQLISMAGSLPEAAVQTVIQHADGNPFLVATTLQGLVEIGALSPSATGWRFDPSAVPERLRATDRVAHVLAMRIARLDDRTRRVLSIGALLGRTFDPALVADLADLVPRDVVALVEASRGRLVWAARDGSSFTFIHDKVREALLQTLADQERRRLHRSAAERIEAEQGASGERAFDLAYHFDAAGETARAAPHALTGAERARARFALELAERLYRIATRGTSDLDTRTRYRIAKGLAEVLMLRGAYTEASERFQDAMTIAATDRDRAEVQERWSQLELKQGNLAAACAHAENALRLIGRWVPRSKVICTFACLWELLVQVLHTRFPRLFLGRRPQASADDVFAMRVYHSLNGPYFFSKGPAWAAWAHLRLMNQAERHPPSLELARAYAVHGGILSGFPGLFPRGIRVSKLGADMCEARGDIWGQAQGMTFYAAQLHFSGRLAEAVEAGRRSAELFDRAGDRWEANSGLDFAVTSLLRLGDLGATVELARQIYRRGQEINDAHALAWSLDAWVRATDGKGVPRAWLAAERARSAEHVQTSSVVEMAEGVRLMGEGELAQALTVFQQAEQRFRREVKFFHDLNAPLIVYQATVLRKMLDRTSAWNVQERERLLKQARRAVAKALTIGRRFQNNLSHALRESAYIAAAMGDARHARRDIDQSVTVAEQRQQRYEAAQSRLARAQLARDLGWADVTPDLQTAEAELAAITAPVVDAAAAPRGSVTLSLLDRYETVLTRGREIATALSAEALYPTLRAAALELLRADGCLILGGQTESDLTCLYGDAGLPFSRPLAVRAIAEGRAQTLSGRGAQDDETLHLGALKSVLCVPILVRGRAFGCLYVAHRQIEGVFGEEEKRIAEFLATLAGAALENAEGFAQIQQFSRVLEVRVQERTAELAHANHELMTNLRKVRETQDQLVQAGKMAAVGTLVAGLSHELNTPLGIVLGYVQSLVRLGGDQPVPLSVLTSIERQTLRCRELVRALLDFSRMKPLVREAICPQALFGDVIQLVDAKARQAGVQITVAPEDHLLSPVQVSQQGMQSVLLNLITNAIDASQPGATVTLDVTPESRDGRPGISFLVRDEGSGIPERIRARIFDPFFTTKEVGKGTGLGLSLARQIVQDHDGQLEIDTAEGRGTTARVWIAAPSKGEQPSAAQSAANSVPTN